MCAEASTLWFEKNTIVDGQPVKLLLEALSSEESKAMRAERRRLVRAATRSETDLQRFWFQLDFLFHLARWWKLSMTTRLLAYELFCDMFVEKKLNPTRAGDEIREMREITLVTCVILASKLNEPPSLQLRVRQVAQQMRLKSEVLRNEERRVLNLFRHNLCYRPSFFCYTEIFVACLHEPAPTRSRSSSRQHRPAVSSSDTDAWSANILDIDDCTCLDLHYLLGICERMSTLLCSDTQPAALISLHPDRVGAAVVIASLIWLLRLPNADSDFIQQQAIDSLIALCPSHPTREDLQLLSRELVRLAKRKTPPTQSSKDAMHDAASFVQHKKQTLEDEQQDQQQQQQQALQLQQDLYGRRPRSAGVQQRRRPAAPAIKLTKKSTPIL